ncbi:hypothetical protein FSW04_11840 [Baekduia soli]|uniref:Uncharacterized protein n=1 Tax=Baekduia soli TaxID=496014 RepID=A0A5B8U4Y3_9ACTN|nr:hypothetical protein [Baekduia soli]QEC48189.1 hypothetical protein FSW04_11840 [Baekduia soli]
MPQSAEYDPQDLTVRVDRALDEAAVLAEGPPRPERPDVDVAARRARLAFGSLRRATRSRPGSPAGSRRDY